MNVEVYSIDKFHNRHHESDWEFEPTDEYPEFVKLHADVIICSMDVSLVTDIRKSYVVVCGEMEYEYGAINGLHG
jgi:hypothetical protein